MNWYLDGELSVDDVKVAPVVTAYDVASTTHNLRQVRPTLLQQNTIKLWKYFFNVMASGGLYSIGNIFVMKVTIWMLNQSSIKMVQRLLVSK